MPIDHVIFLMGLYDYLCRIPTFLRLILHAISPKTGMASFEIVLCDPLSVSKRKYVPRIPNQQWVTVKNDVAVLHRNGWKHKAILAYLRSQRGLNPTCVFGQPDSDIRSSC